MKRDPVLFEFRLNKRFVRRCALLLPLSILLLLGPSGISQEPDVPLFPTTSFEPFFATALPLVEPPGAFVKRASNSTHVDFVELGDFDEDGTQDLMVSAGNVLQFHPGDGKGGFAFGPLNLYQAILPEANGQVVIGSNTQEAFFALSHAVADFNNDGHLDVVAIVNFFGLETKRVQQRFHIFLGNGKGVFRTLEPRVFSEKDSADADRSPFQLIAYDVDHDTLSDVLIVRRLREGTRFELMSNAGNGYFKAPVEFVFDQALSGQTVHKVIARDINQNGKLDLAVVLPEQVEVFFDVEQGTFASVQTLDLADPKTPQRVVDVAVVDLNQDGLDDVVMIQGKTVASYLFDNKSLVFNGSIDLGIVLSGLAVGDFNGDTLVDIGLFADDLQLLGTVLGNGEGQFFFDKPIYEHLVAAPVETLVADLEGNGYDDFVERGEFFVQVLLREDEPRGISRASVGNNAFLGTADLNGNSTSDVIVGSAPDVEVMWNNGQGVFLRQPLLKLDQAQLFLSGAAIDVDQDGQDEFVILGLKQADDPSSGFLAVLAYDQKKGEATLLASQRLMIEAVPNMGVGDVNQDGLPDIVTNGKDAITVWSLDAASQLVPETFSVAGQLGVLDVGDYDGDGFAEIVAVMTKGRTADNASSSSDDSGLTSETKPTVSEPVSNTQQAIGTPPEVVLFQYENGRLGTPQTLLSPPTIPMAITSADVNGDGVTDVTLVGLKVEATIQGDLLNLGITGADLISVLGSDRGQFQVLSEEITNFEEGATPLLFNGLAVADFDGDGLSDAGMATAKHGTTLRVFEGKAVGSFRAGRGSSCEGGLLQVSDFNDDGQPELTSVGLEFNPHLCISWQGAF